MFGPPKRRPRDKDFHNISLLDVLRKFRGTSKYRTKNCQLSVGLQFSILSRELAPAAELTEHLSITLLRAGKPELFIY